MKTRKVYHYTNFEAYRSMQTPGKNGYSVEGFDDFKGLIPAGMRFIPYGRGNDLPNKARDSPIYASLEPNLNAWSKIKRAPSAKVFLEDHLTRKGDCLLLSFDLTEYDDAWIVERAIMERAQADESFAGPDLDKVSLNYWNSRVPALDYSEGYDLPMVVIWGGIEFDRLNVEWAKPKKKMPEIDIDDFLSVLKA